MKPNKPLLSNYLKAVIIFACVLVLGFGILSYASANTQWCGNGWCNYNVCTYHAYRLCSGSNIYWYDSCENQQDIYQTCTGSNMICQYGQCVYQQPVPPVNPYVIHYKTACYGDNIYWYDSLGASSGLYKNCADKNSCTADACTSGKCSNILKCDGSACAAGSADYNSYCAANNPQPQPQPQQINFSVAFFAKQNQASQWLKTVQVNANSQVYFMISVTNNGTAQVDNTNISTNIPAEISSLGNLKIDNVLISGDIVAGINIGSLPATTTKLITFEGRTQAILAEATKQATANVSVSGVVKSDTVSVSLNPEEAAGGASVSSTTATSGFWSFLRRWYLWILVGAVLIFLFIVVYRRLSSNA